MEKERRSPDQIEMDEMRAERGRALGLSPAVASLGEILNLAMKMADVVEGQPRGVALSALLTIYLISALEDSPSQAEIIAFVDEGSLHLSAIVQAMREKKEKNQLN